VRYLAKNVVAAGLADRSSQTAYAIGVAKPLSIYVDCYGTGRVADARLGKALDEVMDLTPRGIRRGGADIRLIAGPLEPNTQAGIHDR
jgi:S-adenosylmethionine synthetase